MRRHQTRRPEVWRWADKSPEDGSESERIELVRTRDPAPPVASDEKVRCEGDLVGGATPAAHRDPERRENARKNQRSGRGTERRRQRHRAKERGRRTRAVHQRQREPGRHPGQDRNGPDRAGDANHAAFTRPERHEAARGQRRRRDDEDRLQKRVGCRQQLRARLEHTPARNHQDDQIGESLGQRGPIVQTIGHAARAVPGAEPPVCGLVRLPGARYLIACAMTSRGDRED